MQRATEGSQPEIAATPRPASALPTALDPVAGVPARLARRGDRPPLAAFLDFDGTLSPIVRRHDAARIGASMREPVRRLARRATVALLSGRDLADVRRRVGLPGLWYAGSHGLEIGAPDGRGLALARGRAFLEALGEAEAALRETLVPIPGAEVERKRYAIAVHFRRVSAAERPVAEAAFAAVAGRFPELRVTEGKEVRELLPRVEWDKGKALRWILRTEAARLGRSPVPLAIGDDVTDEDAFGAVRGAGFGVVVAAGERPTLATHAAAGLGEVKRLLAELALTAERLGRERRPATALSRPAGSLR